jgi:hypothetical protein
VEAVLPRPLLFEVATAIAAIAADRPNVGRPLNVQAMVVLRGPELSWSK